ncbi:MAG: hypothetical protein LBG66_04170 [Gallionellaceae bacterium]|jgi:hypothetical protein|nr:hypothetical protein [Gallionellaceae bacterium]
MRVRLDVLIFSSPVKALGYAAGIVSVSAKPILHQPFPWPPEWIALHPSYFSPQQSLIASVDDSGADVPSCCTGSSANRRRTRARAPDSLSRPGDWILLNTVSAP